MKEYCAVYIKDSVNFDPDFPIALFLIIDNEEAKAWSTAYEYGQKFGVGKVMVRVKKFKVH